jgi:hypothetical protein
LEKNRIYHAAVGRLIVLLSVALPPASGYGQFQQETTVADTTKPPLQEIEGDTSRVAEERPAERMKPPVRGDDAETGQAPVDTVGAESESDTVSTSAYQKKKYVSRGIGDEAGYLSRYYIVTSGDVGQPQLLYKYLNVAGPDIRINGLPFVYGGMYRPYLAAVDLDVLPWEILHNIESGNGVLNVSLGIDRGSSARSDVELGRGPYGYNGTRWRFAQPVEKDMHAYFTVGFKKSNGYFPNTDYDGYHVCGGVKKSFLGGDGQLDVWQHRARYGLRSFDYMVPQTLRQSRGVYRYEFRFKRPLIDPVSLWVTGLYQRSAKTVSGYVDQVKTKYDLGGGRGSLRLSLSEYTGDAGMAYYNTKLYGLPNRRPNVNQFEYFLNLEGSRGDWTQDIDLEYAWNGIDHGAFVPRIRVSHKFLRNLGLFGQFSRKRRFPDLFLLYFDDYVTGLGAGQTLESYTFDSKSSLRMPVTGSLSLGMELPWHAFNAELAVSDVRIDDQIRLSYQPDTNGNVVVTPLNFDDRYMEIAGRFNGSLGPFSGEFSAIYRKWDERYFADGLEKGPVATGFGRLSFLRQFFIKDLYLGGSLQMQASSRRDYRSILEGFTNGYAVFDGRLEFRYKDFTFRLNEDNLLDARYYSLWPYPEQPRTLWWGLRWKFVG